MSCASVKILVAVWGAPYIERLERFGLSSMLADGNLPALARTADVEFVFLTAGTDIPRLEASPMLAEIRRHASIRCAAIDDLIVPGLYALTLTLAFTRGINLYGAAMTETYFVFWNADFVMSDGTLRTIGERIALGQTVVMAGSLRAVGEVAAPLLEQLRGEGKGVLAVQPRDLVRLALDHPHALTVAKTVNQDLCWSSVPNQMFWKIDDATILGRFFQIFMLCLRPKRHVATINGYCDYSFVPEYCPGDPVHVIKDSDEAFLLELQSRDQESELVGFGAPDRDAWRNSLREWWTPEHRLVAGEPLVFHAGDLDVERVGDMVRRSKVFVDELTVGLVPPHSHRGQYYFVSGVAAWMDSRSTGAADSPPELDTSLPVSLLRHPSFDVRNARRSLTPDKAARHFMGWKGALRRTLVGSLTDVRRLHPDYPALNFLADAMRRIRSNTQREPQNTVLVAAELGSWLDLFFPLDDGQVYRIDLDHAAAWRLAGPPLIDGLCIYVRAPAKPDLLGVIDRLSSALRPGAQVSIAYHDSMGSHEGWLLQEVRRCLPAAGARLNDMNVVFHDGGENALRYQKAFARHWPVVRHGGVFARGASTALLGGHCLARLLSGYGDIAPSGTPTAALLTGRAPQLRT
jgi:hypothetical protein